MKRKGISLETEALQRSWHKPSNLALTPPILEMKDLLRDFPITIVSQLKSGPEATKQGNERFVKGFF